MSKAQLFIESVKRRRLSVFIEGNSDDEKDIISKVTDYVKTNNLRVPNPDYITSKYYSPQWKVHGNVYYYRTPSSDGSKIIAIISTKRNIFKFNADGGLDYNNPVEQQLGS